MSYNDLIQGKIQGVYQAGVATKILQHMDRIRNTSDLDHARRWVMELLQNARDTAYDDASVRVEIEMDGEVLRFRHNGRPFRVKDILSIVNQVSSKQPDEKTVGRFGTGFMTTYQLSEEVEIASVLSDVEPQTGERLPYKPFRVSLDRRGRDNNAILSAIAETMAKLSEVDNAPELTDFDPAALNTTFTYRLRTAESRLCAEAGLRDLRENVLFVLLFSDKLEAVTIREAGRAVTYVRGETEQLGAGVCRLTVYERGDGAEKRKMLFFLDDGTLMLAACADADGQLLPFPAGTPKLFIDFPLIGAEEFPFPVVVNSLHFHPNEPRSGITLVDNLNSSDAVENKDLIKRAVERYADFLQALGKRSCEGLEHIIQLPAFREHEERSTMWVRAHIYEALFRIVSIVPFIPTDSGLRAAGDAELFLPVGETPQQRELVRKLTAALRGRVTPSGSVDWASALSGYCLPAGKTVSLDSMLSEAQKLLKDLKEPEHAMEWLSALYAAANEYPALRRKILSGEAAIFPSQSPEQTGNLFTIRDLRRDPGIPELLKTVSDTLDGLRSTQGDAPTELRKHLLSKDFRPQEVEGMETYETTRLYDAIRRRSSRTYPVSNFNGNQTTFLGLWRKSWLLMLSCAKDRSLYDLYARLPNHNLPERTELPEGVEAGLWHNSFSGVADLLAQTVERFSTLDELRAHLGFDNTDQTMDWLNGMLAHLTRYSDSAAGREIFPNQLGSLVYGNGYYKYRSEHIHLMLDKTTDAGKELKTIAEQFVSLSNECRYRRHTFDRRLKTDCLRSESLTDERVASHLSNLITRILREHSLSEAPEEQQRGCSMLMAWLNCHCELAEKLFPAFSKDEDRMRLLTPVEAVKLEERASQLENLLLKYGCDSVEYFEKLLAEKKRPTPAGDYFSSEWDCLLGAESGTLSDADREAFARQVGLAGEQFVFGQVCAQYRALGGNVTEDGGHRFIMETENGTYTIEYPDHDGYHQPGWDIRVTEAVDGRQTERYIEVKTHTIRSEYKKLLRMSEQQFRLAMECGGRYAVALATYDKALERCTGAAYFTDVGGQIGSGALRAGGAELYIGGTGTSAPAWEPFEPVAKEEKAPQMSA